MNDKQVAFIICVNDDFEYAECRYYLDRLRVPEGFSRDIITIREATSMTEGYNAGMQSSKAKYKVYMHQDTFIINEHFIQDVVDAFSQDDKIGMLGVIGCRMLPEDGIAVSAWDTGKICHHFGSLSGYQNGQNIEVDAVDGLLMVTQYDLPWREDLFVEWDYYDISQCYEFKRVGYKTVVPFQEECWCYHDNKHTQPIKYVKYRQVFVEEYQDIFPFRMSIGLNVERCIQYNQLNIDIKRNVGELVNLGKIDEVEKILSLNETKSYSLLDDYRVILNIIILERKNGSRIRFYYDNMSHAVLMKNFREIIHGLKRVEYGKNEFDIPKFCQKYSIYASIIIANTYCDNLRRVTAWINEIYQVRIDLGEYSVMALERRKISISKYKKKSIIFAESLLDLNFWGECLTKDIQEALLIVKEKIGEISSDNLRKRIQEVCYYDAIFVRRMIGEEIYVRDRMIIICGAKAQEYAALFHNTDIHVRWYVEDTSLIHRKFSKNIEFIMG